MATKLTLAQVREEYDHRLEQLGDAQNKHEQHLDWCDKQLGELAGVPDRLIDITSLLDSIDLIGVATWLRDLNSLKERVAALEKAQVTREGATPGSNEQLGEMSEALADMKTALNNMTEDVQATVDAFKSELAEMNGKLNLAIRAMGAPPVVDFQRVRIPEPKAFEGARDAKELENFLFDMDQYFRAVKPDSDAAKINIATMYMLGNAKL